MIYDMRFHGRVFMVEKKLVYLSCAFASRASNLPDVSHEVRMMTTIQPAGTVLVSQSLCV